jgi:hypothetical protein
MGRPIGSPNRQKPFADALRMEICAGNDPRHLRAIARKLVDRYEQVIAGNDDALKNLHRAGGSVSSLMRLKGGTLDVCRRDTADRSRRCLRPPQQCRTDIEAITHAALAGKARAHEVAPVVIELALKQCATL